MFCLILFYNFLFIIQSKYIISFYKKYNNNLNNDNFDFIEYLYNNSNYFNLSIGNPIQNLTCNLVFENSFFYISEDYFNYKLSNTYKINDKAFYSKKIDINGKTGYLEINEIDDKYFIEFVYNYSKIESYASKKNLNKTLTTISYILNSIKFQDSLIDSLVGEASLKYHEEDFNIFKANGNDTKFIDVVEQNDDGRMNSKDEDILELDENIN